MLFSSLIFLFLFLPVALAGYYLSVKKIKNYWLLLVSLVFFAWGGVSYTLILLCSIVLNYFFGLAVAKNAEVPAGKKWITFGVTCNLLLLAIFKYANFFTSNIDDLFRMVGLPPVPLSHILLPIGISFYTFHSISYLVDIYRGKTTVQRNIFDLALYICMFSQLIAGPIIRYHDVWLQLSGRVHTLQKFSSGIERFIIGLAKKVLLANTFATVADQIFNADAHELGALNAWLGLVCYTFQIYCDFAGYSDMAIGLGRMFGFEFMENFNFPYLATSVKDFWRRWHISLSTFFRDYVYIPLGGNKVKTGRVYLNLVIVFFLTGFWHGASWTFVIWGLAHGSFMIVERLGFQKILSKLWRPLANMYTLIVVMFTWVLFRCDTFYKAQVFWQALFDLNTSPRQADQFVTLFNMEVLTALIIAVLGSFGFFSSLANIFSQVAVPDRPVNFFLSFAGQLMSVLIYVVLFALCSMYLVAGTYNPFIYYQF